MCKYLADRRKGALYSTISGSKQRNDYGQTAKHF